MGFKRRLTLRDLLCTALKNRALVITLFLAAPVVSLLHCMATPPIYRAETKLALVIEEAGLTDLAEGRASIDEAVTEITKDKYYFLRSGARSVNPVMLYESPEFRSVVERLRETYDVTIFDCRPLVENPESVLLASPTDGLILVLQADRTRWEVALSAVRDLQGARVPVIGANLNKKRFIIPEPLHRLL